MESSRFGREGGGGGGDITNHCTAKLKGGKEDCAKKTGVKMFDMIAQQFSGEGGAEAAGRWNSVPVFNTLTLTLWICRLYLIDLILLK